MKLLSATLSLTRGAAATVLLPLEMYTCWDEMSQHLGHIMSLCQTQFLKTRAWLGCMFYMDVK